MTTAPHLPRKQLFFRRNSQFSFCNFQFSILRAASFSFILFLPAFIQSAESSSNHLSPVTNDQSAAIAHTAAALRPTLVRIRRDLHMHPELSNREERTARVVADRLRALGIDEIKANVARHGI